MKNINKINGNVVATNRNKKIAKDASQNHKITEYFAPKDIFTKEYSVEDSLDVFTFADDTLSTGDTFSVNSNFTFNNKK